MKTALIIEDNEDNLLLIKRLLEKSGFRTIGAETGNKGFELALEKRPDFILLDIQLPDIMGTEVVKMIRESDIGESIPVIAVTSYAMAGDREKMLSAGCNGYIEKPIDPEMVVTQIRKLIGETP